MFLLVRSFRDELFEKPIFHKMQEKYKDRTQEASASFLTHLVIVGALLLEYSVSGVGYFPDREEAGYSLQYALLAICLYHPLVPLYC